MVKHSRRRRPRPEVRYPLRPLLLHCARPGRGDARRVLSAFLKLRCEGGKPTTEVFDRSHVERMLRSGRSEDAHSYLERFLPVNDRSPLSWRLIYQVGLAKTLATVAAGGKDGAELAALYKETGEYMTKWPFTVRLNKVIAQMNADPIRSWKLWQEILPRQIDRIMNLMSKCPELQGDVRLPRKRILLWDHTTHGLCKCPSRRRKTTNPVPSHVLIHEFLQTRLLTAQGRNGSEKSPPPSAGVPCCCGVPRGWLALSDQDKSPTRLLLWDPTSGAEIALPPLNNIVQVFLSDVPLITTASPSPPSPSWVALASQRRGEVVQRMYFWRPGDESWSLMMVGENNSTVRVESLAFHDGKVFFTDHSFVLVIYDLNAYPPTRVRMFSLHPEVTPLCRCRNFHTCRRLPRRAAARRAAWQRPPVLG